MKRPRWLWTAFAICLAVVLAALGWTSGAAVRLDRAEAAARAEAALEENVRLALWRMDSALAPLVAQESVRQPVAGRSASIAPPAAKDPSRFVLARFRLGPRGPVVVEASAGESQTNPAAAFVSRLAADAILAQLPPDSRPQAALSAPQGPGSRVASRRGQSRGAAEFQARNEAIVSNVNSAMTQQQILGGMGPTLVPEDPAQLVLRPLWIDGQLVLARRTSVVFAGSMASAEGCLLDWPALRAWLLEEIADLLPDATLRPLTRPGASEEARRLAAMPIELEPRRGDVSGEAAGSPILVWLAVAWASVLLAASAVAVLLLGVVRLSERRAAFVSAVTHELRTPLTTLHMYAEMLAEGMVREPQERQHYLDTLRAEADRLGHLVENVLAYARLERTATGRRSEITAAGRLVEDSRDRLAQRAAEAGMELLVSIDESAAASEVAINRSSLEQILFNLVDNACKYAASAADRRIHLAVEVDGRHVLFRVADHGPGIEPAARRRLFRPFSKSASEAATSAPGVGLGLALSRRLARDMGGRLVLDADCREGAAFVLRLPLG